MRCRDYRLENTYTYSYFDEQKNKYPNKNDMSVINPDYAHRYIAMINYTNFRTANSALERIKSLFVALKNCPIYVLYKVLHKPIRPRDDLFYQNYKC